MCGGFYWGLDLGITESFDSGIVCDSGVYPAMRGLSFCVLSGQRRNLRVLFAAGTAALIGLSFAAPVVADDATPPPANPKPSGPPPGPPVQVNPIPGSGATPLPKLKTYAWLIANMDTGQILATKGPDTELPQASTMKTLTALTLMPRLDPNSTYTATEKDANADGSRVGIVPGATYKVRDLWDGLLLPSGNDAAEALAAAYGGDGPTIQAMEAEAQRIGALHTHPKTPSGLDAPGQVSTPADLATIYRQVIKLPLFNQIINSKQANFPGDMPAKPGGKRESYVISSEDRLLLRGYPGIIGGKSGYTTKAGRTFVGAASRNGVTLVYSIMRTTLETPDAAARLLDWGFANYDKVTPVGQLPDAAPEDSNIVAAPALRYTVDGKLQPGQTPQAAPTPATQAADSGQAGDPADANLTTNSITSPSVGVIRIQWIPLALVILAGIAILIVVLRVRVLLKRRSRRKARQAQIDQQIARDREYELTNRQ